MGKIPTLSLDPEVNPDLYKDCPKLLTRGDGEQIIVGSSFLFGSEIASNARAQIEALGTTFQLALTGKPKHIAVAMIVSHMARGLVREVFYEMPDGNVVPIYGIDNIT